MIGVFTWIDFFKIIIIEKSVCLHYLSSKHNFFCSHNQLYMGRDKIILTNNIIQ